MNIRPLTDADYPQIVDIHNSLNIVWPTWPRDAQAWMEADRNRDPKCKFQRWVAKEDGKIVGAASFANHLDDYHPQKFYINIEVREAYRECGIGSALYNQLMNALQPHHPRILRTDILENQIQSYLFVQKRGFHEAWRETPVHIDVATFDDSPYAGLENNLHSEGIEIKSLHALENDTERDHKVYTLYMQLAKDVPSELGEFTPSPYADWTKWCLNDPDNRCGCFFYRRSGGKVHCTA